MSRPLPLITPFNEFFWTGGADDELRFQRCQSCGTLCAGVFDGRPGTWGPRRQPVRLAGLRGE